MRLDLIDFSAWAPGLVSAMDGFDECRTEQPPVDDGAGPEIRFVSPMLRRRLGPLARMALHVAHEVSAGFAGLTTVFASRHGELTRTVGILHALARDEAPSPTAFSLSVHNATVGIHSIIRSDQAPSTALAAGDETLLWGFQEAAARLMHRPDLPVLLVYADETLPVEYEPFGATSEVAHAIAFLLASGNRMELEWTGNDGNPPSPEPLSLAILDHLLGRRKAIAWYGERLFVQGRLNG